MTNAEFVLFVLVVRRLVKALRHVWPERSAAPEEVRREVDALEQVITRLALPADERAD